MDLHVHKSEPNASLFNPSILVQPCRQQVFWRVESFYLKIWSDSNRPYSSSLDLWYNRHQDIGPAIPATIPASKLLPCFRQAKHNRAHSTEFVSFVSYWVESLVQIVNALDSDQAVADCFTALVSGDFGSKSTADSSGGNNWLPLLPSGRNTISNSPYLTHLRQMWHRIRPMQSLLYW